MGRFAHKSTVRFAIIQASSQKDHAERLVIAYADENGLRGLIAAPSIVGLGFTSREEAMAELVGSVLDSGALTQESRRTPTERTKARPDGESAARCGLVNRHRIAYHILQSTLSMIAILLYSKNPFSVMLRVALGFSS